MAPAEPTKAARIADNLLRLTNHSRVEWSEGYAEESYQTTVGDYVIQIRREMDEEVQEYAFSLAIRRSDGRIVDEIYPGWLSHILSQEFPTMSYFQIFEELHAKARRLALGVDAAYEQILLNLK